VLKYGSKEPLIAPVVHVDVELAPGSVATAESLTPPVAPATDVQLAPGSVATAVPLTPPVGHVDALPAAP